MAYGKMKQARAQACKSPIRRLTAAPKRPDFPMISEQPDGAELADLRPIAPDRTRGGLWPDEGDRAGTGGRGLHLTGSDRGRSRPATRQPDEMQIVERKQAHHRGLANAFRRWSGGRPGAG